jgi:TonB family protein
VRSRHYEKDIFMESKFPYKTEQTVYSIHDSPAFKPMPKILSASFAGRYGRLNYLKANVIIGLHELIWTLAIAAVIAAAIIFFPDRVLDAEGEVKPLFVVLILLVFLGCYIPNTIYQIRSSVLRLHDLNRPGVYYFIMFIPFANLAFAIYLLAAPGMRGLNNFGMPSEPSSKIYAFITVLLFALILAAMTAGLLAEQNAPKATNPETQNDAPAGAIDDPTKAYLDENLINISKQVGQFAVYPPSAKRAEIAGKLTVSFTINHDGAVSDVVIKESSGHDILDEAGIAAVIDAAPFPAPPAPVRLSVPISFNIQ